MISKNLLSLCCFLILVQLTVQDTYMQNPRGSNNRLNERKDNRQNNNRLFDSQNNNRGGYNVGDDGQNQYQMKYLANSHLRVEWTQQHGCGYSNDGATNINCNVLLQYMCQDSDYNGVDKIRDGVQTNSNNEDQADPKNGQHESLAYYKQCKSRPRNKGLFTADQKLRGDTAIYTRQNPNGGRSGYECPEERDYWPYWAPNPWNDIVLITSDSCQSAKQSSNIKPRNVCAKFNQDGSRAIAESSPLTKAECVEQMGEWVSVWNYHEKLPQHVNQKACEQNGGEWGLPWDFEKKKSECLKSAKAPECVAAQQTRENHLGEHRENKDKGTTNYDWKLPSFSDNKPKTCVLRLRYNISSNTYDQATTDYTSNNKNNIIQNNPKFKLGPQTLQLNINTNQVGRVFQDRSHAFEILPRSGTGISASTNVYNLNVRGRRGNIVQTFPATEYDFVPQYLGLNASTDVVHIQWTGSNTSPQGTDRNNFVLTTRNHDYPIQFTGSNFLKRIQEFKYLNQADSGTLAGQRTLEDLALYLTTSGYHECVTGCAKKFDNSLDGKLQKASASFPGAFLRFKPGKSETFYFMSTVNNDFSNRRQLGVLQV